MSIILWVPIKISRAGGDFASVRSGAISIVNEGTLDGIGYFNNSPNNVNITIYLSFLYSIIGDWRTVVLVGAVSTNISMFLAVLSVYNCTNNKTISIFMYIYVKN